MKAEELIEGFIRLNLQTYSYGSIIKRFFGINRGRGIHSVAWFMPGQI